MKEKAGYLESVNLKADTAFPFLLMEASGKNSFPKSPGFQVMHWHEDFQLIYVLQGSIEIQTLSAYVKVCAGQGIFINKKIVHRVWQLGDCSYRSMVFPDYFLKFYLGSPAEALVDSLSENESLEYYAFTGSCVWEKEVLDLIRKLSEKRTENDEFYSYEILVMLTQFWLIFRKNIPLPAQKEESAQNTRMRLFLNYIGQHYSEEISLEELAGSANVSPSECLRAFRKSLQTTPHRYLLEFRLSKAEDLLRTTELPIGDIAGRTGFGQSSHFGKCFREKMGLSPREYRERQKN